MASAELDWMKQPENVRSVIESFLEMGIKRAKKAWLVPDNRSFNWFGDRDNILAMRRQSTQLF